MASLTILFLAFGLGLDPRNSTTFGPALAPFLIGFSVSLTLFAGGIARKGYLGACKPLPLLPYLNRIDLRATHHRISQQSCEVPWADVRCTTVRLSLHPLGR